MEFIIAGAVLLILVVGEVELYLKVIKGLLAGKKFWQVITTLAGLVIGLAAMIVVTSILWKPVTEWVMGKLSSPDVIDPMVAAIAISLILTATIWLAFAGVRKWIIDVFGETHAVVAAKLLAIMATLYVVLDLTGVTRDIGGPWWWVSRIMAIPVFLEARKIAIDFWFKGKAQDRWGVSTTYAFCVLATWYVLECLGWSVTANILHSIMTIGFFLTFNFFLFWTSYALGDPDKKLKRRLGYYLNYIWVLVLIPTTAIMIYLQATGRVGWIEQETARLTTLANRKVEELERSLATKGLTDTLEALNKAIASNDLSKSVELRNKVRDYNQAQKKVERGKMENPEGIEKTINLFENFVKTKFSKKKEGGDGKQSPQNRQQSLSGQTFGFTVNANQVYTIDKMVLKPGQEFTFLTYDAPIEYRVRDEEATCWQRVTNNLPWRALVSGPLQIRAGNQPANVTLNIGV